MRELRRLAEDEPERRLTRAEVGRRRDRDIHLQRAAQKEHAIDPRARRDVEVVDTSLVVVHDAGDAVEHRQHVARAAHAEREIDVRPAVLAADRCRAGDRASGDARVSAGVREHDVADAFAIGGSEDA